jgi:hypothetical protein
MLTIHAKDAIVQTPGLRMFIYLLAKNGLTESISFLQATLSVQTAGIQELANPRSASLLKTVGACS